MQCNRCGSMLPPGVPNCPYCANPTPYNVVAPPPNVPPPPTNYGQTPYPPPGPHAPYSQPPYPSPAQQIPYGQPMMVPMAAPPKRSGCSTAAIIVLILLLIVICGGSVLGGGLYISKKNANATVTSMNDDATSTASEATYTTELTPTAFPPYTESNSPSGANFSEAAQQVISSAQLANAIDSNYRPTELQSGFRGGQTIYLVYKWVQGNAGYVQTRWYYNGEMKDEVMSRYINQYAAGYGYMTNSFYAYGNTGQGTIEVFWCQDANCKHGGLAWVRPFSVSAS